MKYTLALLAAAALMTSDVNAINVHSVAKTHKTEEEEEVDHSGEFYEARDSAKDTPENREAAKYIRAIPSHFSAGTDDLFMRSMLTTYCQEGKNKDGSPNGLFVMDEAGAKAASSEVLGTHKGLSGAALSEYLKTYFPRTWAHYDVNKTGKIGVEVMPAFMRFLASDQTLTLQ